MKRRNAVPKGIKPERVAGIVALSYLVLIPAGAYYAWGKVKNLEADVNELWERAGYPPRENMGPLGDLKRFAGRLRSNRVNQEV
jgi:hypothetical protein